MVKELTSPNGHLVYYGENALDNERLTFDFSHKGDIWFHAHNVPGSHVLLRCMGGEKVCQTDIQFSANVAARHSKSRHIPSVPIIFCVVSNVSKPKQALVGTVQVHTSKYITGKTTTI